MRLGNPLLHASLLLVASNAWADGFLSKSPLLAAARVEIVPAQRTSDGLILPVLQSERSEPKLFLTSEGNYPLASSGSAKKRKLNVHSCGEDAQASPWKSSQPIKGTGYFVASGKALDTLKLTWLSATKIAAPTAAKCLSYAGYTTTELSVARVNTVQQNLFFANFKSPEAIRWDALYARLKEKAYTSGPPDCKVGFGLQRVGLVHGDKCDVLLESKIDCEGQGYARGSFGRPLGVLEITRGSENERWLVFKAAGYEGDAYLGIRLSTERPPAEKDIDFYVYSGC